MVIKNLKSNLDEKNNEMIEEISRLSGGQISSLELIAVVYGFKPTMAEMINFNKFNKSFINKLDKINRLCKELSLHFVVSRYKFIINSPRGIFEMIDLDSPQKGKIAIGISKDKSAALEGVDLYYKKTLVSEKGRRFGQVMGYPECCLDFGDYLCQNSKGDKNHDPNNFGFTNPAVESLKRSKEFAWQLNVFTNSPLSYYPCTLNCQESIKYVNKLFKILKRINPTSEKNLMDILKEPISLYWTCVDKILLYGDFKGDFENSEVKYHKSVPKIKSRSFYQSNSSNFLNNLNDIYKKIQRGNRLVMAPAYFEIYKDKKRIIKIKKDNQYEPVLVKPNK
ncbi:hypothetical protein KJ665_00930 [Patescibacteria group bacterium]|nr:hypothetical protein [Patescibacteria group bacterium]